MNLSSQYLRSLFPSHTIALLHKSLDLLYLLPCTVCQGLVRIGFQLLALRRLRDFFAFTPHRSLTPHLFDLLVLY
jgi:hypothetical protein